MTLDKKLKEKIVNRIVAAEKPLKIILFGSYAYGNPTEDSDLDLLIVKEHFNSSIEEKRKIRKVLKDIDLPKDVLVVNKKDYDFYTTSEDWINSIYSTAKKSGELLYEL